MARIRQEPEPEGIHLKPAGVSAGMVVPCHSCPRENIFPRNAVFSPKATMLCARGGGFGSVEAVLRFGRLPAPRNNRGAPAAPPRPAAPRRTPRFSAPKSSPPRRSPQTGSCLCPPPRGFRTTRTSTTLAAAMDAPTAVFSRRNPPQGLPRTGQADAEPPRRGAEIPAVERRQGVGASVCRGFKDHFATGVARHRPPRKAGGNRPGRGTRGGNDHLDPVPAQPGSHSPPWAPAHRPALEGQGCGKGPKQTAFPAPFQAVWRMPRTGRGTPQPQHWCPVPAA